MGRQVKHKKPKTKEGRKRAFQYRPLKEKMKGRPSIPETGFHKEAYEFFKSIRWDNAWKEFLVVETDGRHRHKTANAFCKHYVGDDHSKNEEKKQKVAWMYAAIGPMDDDQMKKHLVPYLGDWENMRSSLFIGEMNRDSLLFGNPKVSAIREIVKKHFDVLEISQGIADVLIEWLGRYQLWAQQIDEHFDYKLFDPKLDAEANDERFKSYTKKQEYMFSRILDCTRQVLRCFGVGEDNVSLLTQMMIQAMRSKLGDGTANMMLAAAGGMKSYPGMAEGNKDANAEAIDADAELIEGLDGAFKKNSQLKLMLGTFAQKSSMYNMENPDLKIDGVDPDDTSTDPAKDPSRMKKKPTEKVH